MGRFDEACTAVVDNVEGAIACGVVDLDSGELLGRSDAGGEVLDAAMVGAAVELFRGAGVLRINEMVHGLEGAADDPMDEVQVSSKSHLYFNKRLEGGGAVMTLVCDRSTKPGMGWAQVKRAVASLQF